MAGDRIKVWDPLVRLFHWSVVACVATAWFTAEEFRTTHEWAGFAVVGLMVLRGIWGLVGSRYARFSQFIHGPAVVLDYSERAIAGQAPRYVGHNPAGAWMAITLMLTLLALGVTGWMMTLDPFFGDDTVKGMHELLANGLLVLIAMHLSGALVTGWKHGENLVGSMITGTKRKTDVGDID